MMVLLLLLKNHLIICFYQFRDFKLFFSLVIGVTITIMLAINISIATSTAFLIGTKKRHMTTGDL